MSELSKTAQQAQRAVARGEKKDAVTRTPEQVINDMRKNLNSHLAVPPDDVRVLLAEYDKLSNAELGN